LIHSTQVEEKDTHLLFVAFTFNVALTEPLKTTSFHPAAVQAR
jgi:hypothetical protein